ncbi:extracellular solute-binding protein [Mesorhizobium sp. M2A.F.Ca.ET.043.02.1.1]|uniref:ABC transporter substrate-binding protein n=1 Tax=unclassified Mesorhizobium TaxID=325217 RepID=UPI000F74F8C9|nr:extracellular solute-binding protein [Mesorhizobium sp. M2A.F.Ca.ET.043.02.1.1]RWB42823.1 MAG: extracellular solute-binding protein [Mesorhizobium sp.]RWB64827.1 MAG: extracellular solute-binding protein [Mesorhizobium sp.]RWB88261.1 MAG: extracellular solute-binding protein [Mesorhizobium sp.]RWC16778.1 MAG: extracellular solute-binding protein [Mesorhizobium sp.]
MRKMLFLATTILAAALYSASANAEQKEVTVWSWFVQSTMEKSIAAFEKAHPDIKVKYTYYNYSPEYITALKAAAASGSLPDVIGLQPGSLTQQYRENLEAVNERAAKQWGDKWAEKIFPVNRKQMLMGNPKGDENYYIIPQESQVLCIWYNRKIFEKLNLSPPKTYADLKAAAKALTDGGYIPMFQGAADGWQNENVFLMLANQFSPGIVDKAQAGETPWTAPELVAAMKAWKGLFDDGIFQQGALGAHAYPTGAQLFAQGKVGMMALGSWWMQESKFPPPLSEFVQNMEGFDFFYMPPVKDGNSASPPVGGIDIGYGLTKNGGKNPEAWTFLAELTNGVGLQEALNDLNDLPAFDGNAPKGDITDHVKDMSARFMADLPKAENQRFASPAVAEALDNALAGVAAGSTEPEAALAAVQAASEKALAAK